MISYRHRSTGMAAQYIYPTISPAALGKKTCSKLEPHLLLIGDIPKANAPIYCGFSPPFYCGPKKPGTSTAMDAQYIYPTISPAALGKKTWPKLAPLTTNRRYPESK
ncbi:hypothetical protein CEXT_31941 [Caerostris extrusa]|uniref:Uncharacterized protein n=1 Tax=Caerostris extrusa TaxID=172846 RepID=A0AAV4RW41_CAEEX|nr:hypothetical protein CEXT_31941 [Caerostris extrusa]